MNTDSRGVVRGQCTVCADCSGYDGGDKGLRCVICKHPPAKHADLSAGGSATVVRDHLVTAGVPSGPKSSPDGKPQPQARAPAHRQASPRLSPQRSDREDAAHPHFTVGQDSSRPGCQMPGCSRNARRDLNTGDEYPVCSGHMQDYLAHGITNTHISAGTLVDSSLPPHFSPPNPGAHPTASLHPRKGRPRSSAPRPAHKSVAPPLSASPDTTDADKDPQSSLLSWLFSQRPRTARDGPAPASPVPRLPPHRADATSNPMSSSQSTPVLHSPQVAAVTPPVPPDQQCKLPGCTRVRYAEPGGRVHEFCGRTHAGQFSGLAVGPVPPAMKCGTPGCPRPKRQKDDGSGYFDFCSISCRNSGRSGLEPSASTPQLGTTPENTCILPTCSRRKYTDPANGRVHDYCCRSHAFEARQQGIVTVTDNVTITVLSGQEFQRVSAVFTRTWATGKGPCPTLSFIFEVKNTKLSQRWTAYQKTLSQKGMEEHYHGTKLTCNITATRTLCTDQDCGICGICSSGLDRRCIRKNINFQRFGHGFYLAPNSSKCHDYTQGAHGYRAMLLCEVLPGTKHHRTQGDQNLKGPPPGHDSVYGKSGGELNYDEIVVYNPDCVMPRYVCVYQKGGTNKIAS